MFIQILDALCLHHPDLLEYQMGPRNWLEVQHLLNFFRPFAEASTYMSAQKYSTIGGVILFFNAIMDHLGKYKSAKKGRSQKAPPAIIKQAAEAAFEKLVQYYQKTNMMYCVVTLLDPRCNVTYFKRNGFPEEWTTSDIDR
jgi:hypothetical protein